MHAERESAVLTPFSPFRMKPAGERWLAPGLRKYSCQLTINTNTVYNYIKLSDNNRTATHVEHEFQQYPDHPDRFHQLCPQLLCREGLTGRFYYEVEWRGAVNFAVSYRGISRNAFDDSSEFGKNDQSWNMSLYDGSHYNENKTSVSSSLSSRVAVYVDCPAGTLSYYKVSSDTLIHIQTINTTFTEPLFPGFGFWFHLPGSISLSRHRKK